MSIGIMTIVKNEAQFIGYGIMSVLDYVDEIVYADGNSTDGTLELINHIKERYDTKDKIKLYKGKDCKNLFSDYTRLFNWTLNKVKSDYVWFCHPDMICTNPQIIRDSVVGDGLRYSHRITSIAGDKYDKLILGRTDRWATIFKRSHGLHYYGNYGAPDEDFYFRDITQNEHVPLERINPMPYVIYPTNINVLHFCECKPYNRRFEKMCRILKVTFPHLTDEQIIENAKNHPRVTLERGEFNKVRFDFEIIPNALHGTYVWKHYHKEFDKVLESFKKG